MVDSANREWENGGGSWGAETPAAKDPITVDQRGRAFEIQRGRLRVVSRQRCADSPPVSFDIGLEPIGIDPGFPQHFLDRDQGVELPAGADKRMIRWLLFSLQPFSDDHAARGVQSDP